MSAWQAAAEERRQQEAMVDDESNEASLEIAKTAVEANETTLKQGFLSALIGSANGAASIGGDPGRTITRLNATIEAEFALLEDAVVAKLVSLIEAGSIAADEADEMATGYTTGLASAGADSTQQSTLAGTFQTDLTTSVSSSTVISATDQATIVANVSGSSSTSTGSTSAQTFTLTSGVDDITGTSGTDNIIATTAANMGSLDSINGGAGNDTLLVVDSGTAATTFQAASMSGVEVVSLTSSNAGVSTFNLLTASGVTTVRSSGSSVAPIFDNVGADVTTLEVINSAVGARANYTATAVSGSTDNKSINLSNVTGGTVQMDSVETLNIESAGSANTITTLTASTAATLNVSGAVGLTITNDLGTTVTTFNASTATGAIDADFDAGALTVTGGSANDNFDFDGAGNANVSGGAGDDIFAFDATATLTTADTVSGGDGTDELRAQSTNLTGYTAPATATISGIESIRVNDALAGDLTTANVQAGINTVDLAAGKDGTARAITMEAGSKNLEIGASTGANGLTVNDTGSATNDNLTITNTATTADDMFDGNALTVNGFETLTIVGTGGAAEANDLSTLTMAADTGGTATVNFSGTNNFTFSGAITAAVVNASGLTGTAILDMNAAAGSGLTSITGSGNADDLAGDASSSIDGGAGSDSIDGGSGNDTLIGGAGDDVITSAAGNDNIDGGAGNDTITLAGNIASGDTINGGDGTDTLSVTSAGMAVIDGYSISASTALAAAITNMERLSVSDQFNTGVDFDMARLNSIDHITLVDGISGSETFSGLANNTTVVVNADNNGASDILTLTLASSTGTADTLNYTMTQAADDDYSVVAVSGVETLNITANEATASATVRVATLGLNITTATAGTTVNFSGTETITIDTVIAAQTVNASSMNGGAFIMTNTTGSGLAQTFTTAGGADTIYAGGGVDTIDAGAGGDSIIAGSGADSITAGTGADTIDGGAGSDTVILTESTAAIDRVQTTYSEAGASIDTVTGFTTGTGGDVISLTIANLEAVTAAGGIASSATNFEELFDGNDVAAGAATLELITSSATVADATQIIGLQGAVFASAGEVETALETGGSFQLTVDAAAANANGAFVVVYTNGTDAKVAAVHQVTESADDTNYEAGDLNVIDLVTISGVSSIGASTFASTNFVIE